MRFVRCGLLGAVALAVGAQAHDGMYPSARQTFPWQLAAQEPDRTLFVGNIQRVGGAATFEVMTVLREPNKGYVYDAETQAGLVDCATKRYELDLFGARVLNSAPVPPPLVLLPTAPIGVDKETLDDVDAPAKGSAFGKVLDAACGEAKLPDERIDDPYRWARERFGLRTPPPPWEKAGQ